MKQLSGMLLLTVLVNTQKLKPCETPLEWTGRQVSIDPSRVGSVTSRLSYDARGERISLVEEVDIKGNKTFHEYIFLYQERVMYKIDFMRVNKTVKCVVEELKDQFHRFEIPRNATGLGRFVIGTNAFLGDGVEVKVFAGDVRREEPFVVAVTSEDCLPVYEVVGTKYGPIHTSYFDIQLGVDPNRFVPPAECDSVDE